MVRCLCDRLSPTLLGQYLWHFGLPASTSLVNMTIAGILLSHAICQKSFTVSGIGAWEAI